ncbi:MAG: TrmH family RNA methyltransferase [Ramlibacter sp.]|nr:TrmH family RNA methyltransferase [Ramlibacter sp.]
MTRGFASIGLDRCKDAANLGGVLRAAHCYGAASVAIAGGRLGKYATDTMRAYKHVPCMEVDDVMSVIPYGAIPVVVELCDRAKSLVGFTHPESAYYIFGPEDGSVSRSIIERAPLVVQIPTRYCMNLAATVNVVLYDRLMKRGNA